MLKKLFGKTVLPYTPGREKEFGETLLCHPERCDAFFARYPKAGLDLLKTLSQSSKDARRVAYELMSTHDVIKQLTIAHQSAEEIMAVVGAYEPYYQIQILSRHKVVSCLAPFGLNKKIVDLIHSVHPEWRMQLINAENAFEVLAAMGHKAELDKLLAAPVGTPCHADQCSMEEAFGLGYLSDSTCNEGPRQTPHETPRPF